MKEETQCDASFPVKKLRGFLLIEVALALCALGILTAMVVPLIQNVAVGSRRVQTQKACEVALRALAVYVETHGWLPYAAEKSGEAVPGLYAGTFPYRTLCLDKRHALDGRGQYLTYIVCPSLTQPPPRNPLHSSPKDPPTFLTMARDDSLSVFYSDGTPVLPSDEEKDFCAVVVMSLQDQKKENTLYLSQNSLEVILPSSPLSFAQWVSRNNLLSLFGS